MNLEVIGEGTVSAAPDKAMIVLGTVTENTSLSAAQRDNAAAVANIVNALAGLGVPNERIQTVNYNIETLYNYEDGTQTFRGYRVTHLLQVTVDRVDQTGAVVDAAVAAGANSVSNIQFMSSQPEAYYNHALTLAVKNAESKAVAMAGALGVRLNRIPDFVREESHPPEPPQPFAASLLAEGAATPIQPGQIKISAIVRVKYSYF